MNNMQPPLPPEHPVEAPFVCQECQLVLTEAEALPIELKEDAGEKQRAYLCKGCLEKKTDVRG